MSISILPPPPPAAAAAELLLVMLTGILFHRYSRLGQFRKGDLWVLLQAVAGSLLVPAYTICVELDAVKDYYMPRTVDNALLAP